MSDRQAPDGQSVAQPEGHGPAALVINPYATRATTHARAAAVRALEPFGLERVVISRGPGAVAHEVRAAVADGARMVASLGGDGTVAEVAGALAGTDIVVLPLPSGGTNVFTRSVGWPADLESALAAIPRDPLSARAADLHLGRLRAGNHDRVFVINIGFGLDAETVHWVEAHPGLKRRLRQLAFVMGAWRSGAMFAREPARLRVEIDGGEPFAAATLLVACGSPYTYLGTRPLDLVPGAAFGNELAWRALVDMNLRSASVAVMEALAGRESTSSAIVGGLFGASLTVRSDPAVAIQCDGEPLGWHTTATVEPGPSLRTLLPERRR
jgi:diacylglycerol kinase family enzyme